jgi:hypothetical protein
VKSVFVDLSDTTNEGPLQQNFFAEESIPHRWDRGIGQLGGFPPKLRGRFEVPLDACHYCQGEDWDMKQEGELGFIGS